MAHIVLTGMRAGEPMKDQPACNQGKFALIEKMTEPVYVAYTRFCGVINAPARIWMVRDWARRNGYHPIGAPHRLLYFDEEGHEAWCEVQWPIAENAAPREGEVGVKFLEPARVVATYHQGDTSTIQVTIERLRAWSQAHGYRIVGPPSEIYEFDVRQPAEHWITEVQLPIAAEAG